MEETRRTEPIRAPPRGLVVVGLGLAAGAAIAFVDNVAFGGEVSPIVIVALLLAVSATVGVLAGARGWVASLAAWAWVPAAHVVKHAFGWPDTLQPNTVTSIVYLGAFTLFVTTAGTSAGLLVRRLGNGTTAREPGSG